MQNKDNQSLFKNTLNKESAQIGHPEDSPSFALNANVDGFRGNGFRYQTEAGNTECYAVPEGYTIIGKIYITDNTLAIFSTDNIDSEIGLVKDCHYETIYNNPCLNFNTKYPINGQARIRKGCERVIYWNDYYNPDRYLNIEEFYKCGIIDCELLKFNPDVQAPCIELLSVNNQGGNLDLGTYSIGVEILDSNENLVYRSDLTRKVAIYDELSTDSYENIDGGYNLEKYSPEVGGVPKTTKSLSLQVSNLDTKFSFLRVFVRRAITGDGVVTESHYLGNLIPITSDVVTFTYTGFNASNGDYFISNSETVLPKVIFDRSRSMEQVQNRLLRANISEPYIDVSEYQKSASKIYTEFVLKPINEAGNSQCLKLTGQIYSVKDLKNCPTLVTYTLTYKVDGVEITKEGEFLNSSEFIFNINEIIACYTEDQVITDIELTSNHIGAGLCDAANYTLEYSLETIEPEPVTVDGTSKDPYTYWLDSTFMDDEVYSFGIGYELDNGYTSPIFHIPGIGLNKIIIDGECLELEDLENEQIFQKCLVIEGDFQFENSQDDCTMTVEYYATFKVGGVEQNVDGSIEVDINVFTGQFSEQIFCVETTEDITDVVLNFNILTGDCTGDYTENISWDIQANSIQNQVENDDVIISVWSPDLIPFTDLSEEDYNDLEEEDKLKYWQVYNTAVLYQDGLTGRMSYHQCSEATYQNPDSCCIDDYWGRDYCGNTLIDKPIRHHRFPCKSLIPPKDYKLGIRFHNIEYPDAKVVSHFFVVGERTPDNMTVLDQGYGGNLGKDDTYTAFSFFHPNLGSISPGPGFADCSSSLNLDEEAFWYLTPRMVFNKEYINGGYIKMLRNLKTTKRWEQLIEVDEYDPQADNSTDVFGGVRGFCYNSYLPKIGNTYYPINKNYILSPYQEYFTGDKKYANLSRVNRIGIIETQDFINLGKDSLALFSFKVNRDVYCNLDTINYKRMHNCNLTITEENNYDIYGGDSFLSKMDVWNHFLWKVNPNYWRAISIVIAGVLLAAAASILTFGVAGAPIIAGIAAYLGVSVAVAGIAIAAASILTSIYVTAEMINTHNDHFRRGYYKNFLCDSKMNDLLDRQDEDLEDYVATMTERIQGVYLTSTVNSELRHYGSGECYIGFKHKNEELCNGTISKENMYAYLRSRLYYWDDGADKVKVRDLFCPEYYGYNKDFSLIYGEKTYFGVPRNFDFCRACTNEFKNTIVYSEKSFDTEETDKFLVYKINNAIDVPAHRGEIFNIKHKSNTLYVQCKETTFAIQPNPQVMKTDKDIITLGTGDFLALPPQELMQTDVGYGGSQSTTSLSNTEHGFVWIDQSKGEIYNIASGLEEISQLKMEPWFKENLPSEFNRIFFETFGEEFPYMNSITDSIGLGLICTYDPKHERLIIHKKDYRPLLPLSQDLNDITQGKIFFNGNLFYTNLKFQQSYPISFEDKTYFENRSWTISYSLKYKKWLSYHSYLPIYMYNDRNFFYTTDGNKTYKHLHNGNYLNFYGIKFPFILEGIHTSLQTSDLHAFHYISTAEEFNLDKDVFIAKPSTTFNQAYFYNLDETSGLLTLQYLDLHTNPYGNISVPENTKTVIRTDENYKISGLRDVSTASPVTSKSWEDIEGYFNLNSSRHGYIDQVPINYDFATGTYNLKDLNDKLLIYRLIYNPTQEDIRLSLVLQNNFTFISNR